MVAAGLKYSKANNERIQRSAERREMALEYAIQNPLARNADIAEHCGVSTASIYNWKKKHPDWAAKFNTVRSKAGIISPEEMERHGMPSIEAFEGNFVERRRHYFGYETPWFQLRTVDAYAAANPGDITLVLMPPEHGKTSLTEDDLTLAIADNPVGARITCISEGQGMARKISRRLMKRLSDDSPHQDLIIHHGPFEPQRGEGPRRQEWGVDAWSVYQSKASDERDYTFATGGWKSAIAGTRATRLHVDDIQSKRSLNQTEDMWDLFRQDMLSRPGETGITTMNGTRVGPRDFYAKMDDEFAGEDFYTKIEFPAIVMNQVTGEPEPLWPRDEELGIGYTMEMLARLRKKVGEEAWWRNYMQKPKSGELDVFSEDGIAKCQNEHRSIDMRRDQLPDVANSDVWIGLDPSIGGINCIAAIHPAMDRCLLVDMEESTGLPRNSAIAAEVEKVILRLKARGWRPTMLVIEAMAFQKGLINDEAFLKLKQEHGLRIESHMTGYNKYDENVGVPSMASTVESGGLDLPYQTDRDRFVTDCLTAQFRAWKPTVDRTTGRLKFKRGNQLRQDQLMALWFVWIWWQELVAATGLEVTDDQAFNMGGLPFAPTRSGLLVPN